MSVSVCISCNATLVRDGQVDIRLRPLAQPNKRTETYPCMFHELNDHIVLTVHVAGILDRGLCQL